jgi:hypothetical protein
MEGLINYLKENVRIYNRTEYSNYDEFKEYITNNKYHQKDIYWLLNLENDKKDINIKDISGNSCLEFLLLNNESTTNNSAEFDYNSTYNYQINNGSMPEFNLENFNTKEKMFDLYDKLLELPDLEIPELLENYYIAEDYEDENNLNSISPLSLLIMNLMYDKNYLKIINKLLDNYEIDVNRGIYYINKLNPDTNTKGLYDITDIRTPIINLIIENELYNFILNKEEYKNLINKLINKGAKLDIIPNLKMKVIMNPVRYAKYYYKINKDGKRVRKNIEEILINNLGIYPDKIKEKIQTTISKKINKDVSKLITGYLGGKRKRKIKTRKVRNTKKSKKVRNTKKSRK